MKNKIFEKSVELFDSKGFSETSIQHIVDELGVTKGTFYYYFTSKEQLLMEIHMQFIDDILSRQGKIIDDSNLSCQEKLYRIVTMLIKNIESQGKSARIFFREMQNLSQEHLSKIFEKRDQFRINLQQLVKLGIEKGEFRQDLDSHIVTLGILGMCNWSYHWFEPDGPLPDVAVAKIYMDLILNGIKS
ncbi:TetR/AcrR family transcriptional regulator [Alkalihalobacillus sp. BA299]|uniref:TetR/AcrR family transcriptional regulator n=1 Tax=Alkalihalobacillus sp. BA299 TaxID=2815938 RepID=UPI001AD9D7B5|nr:TetR/AcrR family transcriptional regulator [Alkalihalobacillus sp. BA299]